MHISHQESTHATCWTGTKRSRTSGGSVGVHILLTSCCWFFGVLFGGHWSQKCLSYVLHSDTSFWENSRSRKLAEKPKLVTRSFNLNKEVCKSLLQWMYCWICVPTFYKDFETNKSSSDLLKHVQFQSNQISNKSWVMFRGPKKSCHGPGLLLALGLAAPCFVGLGVPVPPSATRRPCAAERPEPEPDKGLPWLPAAWRGEKKWPWLPWRKRIFCGFNGHVFFPCLCFPCFCCVLLNVCRRFFGMANGYGFCRVPLGFKIFKTSPKRGWSQWFSGEVWIASTSTPLAPWPPRVPYRYGSFQIRDQIGRFWVGRFGYQKDQWPMDCFQLVDLLSKKRHHFNWLQVRQPWRALSSSLKTSWPTSLGVTWLTFREILDKHQWCIRPSHGVSILEMG